MMYITALVLLAICSWFILSRLARKVPVLDDIATRAIATFDVCGFITILYISYKIDIIFYGIALITLMVMLSCLVPNETQEESYEIQNNKINFKG